MRHAHFIASLLVAFSATAGEAYTVAVVARGLDHPVGITVGRGRILYVSEVPSPGTAGVGNGVISINANTGQVTDLHRGEPEPVNLAFDRNQRTLYWTCRSAGVILARSRNGTVAPVATGLSFPTGIAFRNDEIVFTETPTPGVGGGANAVKLLTGFGPLPIDTGDPQPSDVVISFDRTLYWTCTSAGVIVCRRPNGETKVLLRGLAKPLGIALSDDCRSLLWTEVPTPGVAGSAGGTNAVRRYDFATGKTQDINRGDPQPTDVAVHRDGTVYWTCTSAGVVVQATPASSRSAAPQADG